MIQPELLFIKDDGVFPGNRLPVLHYKKAIPIPLFFAAEKVEHLFRQHNWTNTRRQGICTYDHYHSTTHEAIAAIKGRTVIMFGGEKGWHITLCKGDIVIIPAGVAHKNLGNEKDIICVGGYPGGKDPDMNYGDPAERPRTDKNIRSLSIPGTGPLYGVNDPIIKVWGELLR